MKFVLVSAAALIDGEGRILIAKRPAHKAMGGLWEFPGGKVEDGESPEEALKRELEEELGIETQTADFTPLTFASHAYEDFHLLMPLYGCRRWTGNLEAKEHEALAWARPSELSGYGMPPADAPLIETLLRLL